VLQQAGIATFLADLLTPAEEAEDAHTAALRFQIPMLAERLSALSDGLRRLRPDLAKLPLGFFGASTGGGAAVLSASGRSDVCAVVSRGGRPDLVDASSLRHVRAPTLMIIGGEDKHVLQLNQKALDLMHHGAKSTHHHLVVVPGATHLFEEPGTLNTVANHAAAWFVRHMEVGKAGVPSSSEV